MSKEEAAIKKIAQNIEQIEKLYKECEQIAIESGVGFDAYSPAYGMGGWFNPVDIEKNDYDCENGWYPSSQSC